MDSPKRVAAMWRTEATQACVVLAAMFIAVATPIAATLMKLEIYFRARFKDRLNGRKALRPDSLKHIRRRLISLFEASAHKRAIRDQPLHEGRVSASLCIS